MDGVINLLKPAGMTSHDAVAFVRRVTGVKKVGHSGTLDPLAAGVLPVFVGRATRLIQYMPSEPKTYIAEWIVGIATDTEDTSGTVTRAAAPPPLTTADWREAVQAYIGTIQQRPSAYSAVKVNGRKAYELARRQEPPVLPARTVRIDAVEDIDWRPPYLTATITCSAGTYIRALGRDWAQSLGTDMAMSFLLRSRIGPYWTVETALTWEEIAADPTAACRPIETVLGHMPRLELTSAQRADFACGKRISAPSVPSPAAVWANGQCIGIACYDEDTKEWQPHKVWIR